MDETAPLDKKSNIVLIAEDDDEIRDLLHFELEREGFTVLTVTNGADAVSTASSLKPDVILMDVLMPVMNGIEATRAIKKAKDTRHIPIIMVTVVDKKEDMIEGLEAGAIDYITKPFFIPELKARINAVLRFKRIHDELKLIREQLIKHEMLNTIKETTTIIQETIDANLAVIFSKLDKLHRKKKSISESDLAKMRNAAKNIQDTIDNLGFLESFAFKVYLNISDISDSYFTN
jgi:DNA-binding response OmpR family regulator